MSIIARALSSVGMKTVEIPANTLKIFTRKWIGFRDQNLGIMFVLALLLMWNVSLMTLPLDVLKWWQPWLNFFQLPSFQADRRLSVFAFLMLGVAIFRHWEMMHLLRQGRQWHSRSRGRSYFEVVAHKTRFVRLSHIYRFWEPGGWFILGLLFGGPLGWWFVISASCLAIVERHRNMQELTPYLDGMDAVIEGQQRDRELAHLQGQTISAGLLSIEQSNGLSVGILTEVTPPVEIIKSREVTIIR